MTERGWEESKQKRLALNAFKAAAKAPAATRLCRPRNAKNKVALSGANAPGPKVEPFLR